MCKNRLRNQPSDQESCESSPLSPYAVEKTDEQKQSDYNSIVQLVRQTTKAHPPYWEATAP